MTAEKGTKFSTREWWFIIFTVIMIQFVVQWLSHQFSGSSSALGYISFAGTLVSIILGLVAIIYSFVQSISHTSTAVEVRDQVEKLISAGLEIAKSKDELHASAMELSRIADDLANKVSENTSATKEVVGSVSRLSDAFASGHKTVSSETADDNVDITIRNEAVKSIINSDRILIAFVVVAVAEGCKRGFSIQEVQDKILSPATKKQGIEDEYIHGALSAIVFALEVEGFIELPAEGALEAKLVEKGGFQKRVAEIVPSTLNNDEEFYTDLWLVINKLK